jgi:hypothetical protein
VDEDGTEHRHVEGAQVAGELVDVAVGGFGLGVPLTVGVPPGVLYNTDIAGGVVVRHERVSGRVRDEINGDVVAGVEADDLGAGVLHPERQVPAGRTQFQDSLPGHVDAAQIVRFGASEVPSAGNDLTGAEHHRVIKVAVVPLDLRPLATKPSLESWL